MGGWVGDRLGTSDLWDQMSGKKAEEAARRQQEEFEAEQARVEAERLGAAEASRRRTSEAYRARSGRAATLLTGPGGIEGEDSARRRLLEG